MAAHIQLLRVKSVNRLDIHKHKDCSGYWIDISFNALEIDGSIGTHYFTFFTEDESGDFASQFLTKLRCAVDNFDFGKELDDSWQSEINPEPIL